MDTSDHPDSASGDPNDATAANGGTDPSSVPDGSGSDGADSTDGQDVASGGGADDA